MSRLETHLIHAGEPHIDGAANVPIFQSSVFEHRDGEAYHDIRYPRLSNLPNHLALAQKLAALEGGEDALVAASGLAATSALLFAVLGPGDHLLAQDCLYGGTHGLLTVEGKAFGIDFDFIATRDPPAWAKKLTPKTKAIYVEAITNPLMDVIDHRQVVAFAKEYGLVSIIDATFASPVNFRPLALGYDVVLHSATKYLNGHSDLIAGAIIASREWIKKANLRLYHFGGSLDAHACFLLQRGLKTLALRVRQQNQNALALAEFLARHPAVSSVRYPGLASHPDHQVARALFDGFGGMLAFELNDRAEGAQARGSASPGRDASINDRAEGAKARGSASPGRDASTNDRAEGASVRAFVERLTLPLFAPSLGGVETLITCPAKSSHGGLSVAERRALGIGDHLLRVSVGIEHIDDLVADFAQALG